MKTIAQLCNQNHAIRTGGDFRNLTKQEREYLASWDELKEDQRKEMRAVGIYGPDLGKQRGPVNREASNQSHDLFAKVASPETDRYFDDPPSVEDTRYDAAEAVLKVLYILTGSNHPGLKLATDCLLAIINRSEEKSQAAIARKYGLTRSAVSKRMREMRKGDLCNLSIHHFGGRRDVAEKARVRALRVHKERMQSAKEKQGLKLLERV